MAEYLQQEYPDPGLYIIARTADAATAILVEVPAWVEWFTIQFPASVGYIARTAKAGDDLSAGDAFTVPAGTLVNLDTDPRSRRFFIQTDSGARYELEIGRGARSDGRPSKEPRPSRCEVA